MDKTLTEEQEAAYRAGKVQYDLAGGEAGLEKLANDFYDRMETLKEAEGILKMHPEDLEESRDKLARFLCSYMSGPSRYEEKYGNIRLGPAHGHLKIGPAQRDMWLRCMEYALDQQPYEESFKAFMFKRFSFTAEMCRNQD